MTPGKIFAALSFIFVSVLLIVVFHEVITGNLPSDDREKLENISHKYGPDFFQNISGEIFNCKDRKQNDTQPCFKFPDLIPEAHAYNFVYCMDEDSQINVTYPEGTECFDDAEDQDDYNYSENDKGKTKTEEKEKDEDEDDKNKYSIETCPPKCGRDDNNDEDNEDEEEEEDNKEDEDQ